MSKPIKTLLILIAAAILLLGAVLGILALRSQHIEWTACGEADSRYLCSYLQTDDGLQFRVSGVFPTGSVWQIESTENVQVTEMADATEKKSDKDNKKSEKGNRKSKKTDKEDKGSNADFLLTGSFQTPEHVTFILTDAAQQPLYCIDIDLAADENGVPAVTNCVMREIGATVQVDGEMPYTVTYQIDGSLLFRLKKAEKGKWSLRRKTDTIEVATVKDEKNPDGISYLIKGRNVGDKDTFLVYRYGEKRNADKVQAIRMEVAVQPDGSTALTEYGTETVSLIEMEKGNEEDLGAEDLLEDFRAWAIDLLLEGEDERQEIAEEYKEMPWSVSLPEEAEVDFYTTIFDGKVPAVRFRMNGGIWWLFSGGKMSEQQLIKLVDGTDAAYDAVTLDGTDVQVRTGESCNVFCWTGSQSLLLYNQEEPSLLDNYTDEELQQLADSGSTTVTALVEQDRYWPCVDEDVAIETVQAVCKAAR